MGKTAPAGQDLPVVDVLFDPNHHEIEAEHE
jgi:hypothetical protein